MTDNGVPLPPPRRRSSTRRPNILRTIKMPTMSHLLNSQKMNMAADIPEEGRDLHEYFRTCPSLTRLREEFRAARDTDEENKMGYGVNVCARPEESTGKLLLHCIGLNNDLILTSTGGSAAAISRINHFVLQELLPVHHSAVIEEDDEGRIPFTEAINIWIQARRLVRKWKLDTDNTRAKVDLVAKKWRKNLSTRARSDSDSDASIGIKEKEEVDQSVTGFIRNYSDTKIARRELRSIVESCPDAMFCIDEKGIILLTNEAAEKQFGWTKKELTGSNISIICNKEDGKRHDQYLKHYMETGEKRVIGKKRELKAMRKDGSTFIFELGLTEVKLGGGKRVFCGFCKDLTELKKHTDSLHRGSIVGGKVANGLQQQCKNEYQDVSTRDIPPLVEWSLKILSDIVDSGVSDNHGYGNAKSTTDETDNISESGSEMEFSFSDLNSFDNKVETRGRAKDNNRFFSTKVDVMYNELIVEKIAAIPHLLEELLLIEDDTARRRVFDLSIVKKVLFSTDSLGDGQWLINMLDSGIRVSSDRILTFSKDLGLEDDSAFRFRLKMAEDEQRFLAEGAVFYLERISELNIQDDLQVFHKVQSYRKSHRNVGVSNMISNSDVRHFQQFLDKLFDTVGSLDGMIRRICVLDDDLVKRAAVTPVIRHLLDKTIFSPFASSVALFDGIYHVILVLSFRLGPAPALFHLSKHDDSFTPHQYLIASSSLISCLIYFVLRTIYLGLAKRALSERLFWSDFYSFWNFLDTVPLLMVFSCSVSVDVLLRTRANSEVEDTTVPFFLRSAVALTTPFLWLRILAYIKIRNKQLATFILCSVEIVKDIKWFMLVLLVAMASFAQMWISLTYEPGGLEEPYETVSIEGYLKAYTIMLGDLDDKALKAHPIIVLLFIIYTFGVTIVLLNILIAIVSDSYQSSTISSKMMLGKARIMFASELLSLKSFHKMWVSGKTGSLRRNVNYAFGALSACHLLAVLGTTKAKIQKLNAHIEMTSVDEAHTAFMVASSASMLNIESILVFLTLFFMLFLSKMTMAFILNEFDDSGALTFKQDKSKSRITHAIHWFVKNVFSQMSYTLDSLNDKGERRDFELDRKENSSAIFSGFRTDRKLHRSLEKTKKELKQELKSTVEQLQMALQELEQLVQDNVALTVAKAVAESEERIINAIQLNQRSDSMHQGDSEEPQKNGRRSSLEEIIDDETAFDDSFSKDIYSLAKVMQKLEESCVEANQGPTDKQQEVHDEKKLKVAKFS